MMFSKLSPIFPLCFPLAVLAETLSDGTVVDRTAVQDGSEENQKPKKDDCEDYHEMCEKWSQKGECKANPEYMLLNCRSSCEVCDYAPETRTFYAKGFERRGLRARSRFFFIIPPTLLPLPYKNPVTRASGTCTPFRTVLYAGGDQYHNF